MILELPRPNEQELTPYNKSLYYQRMLEIDYEKKYKMTQKQFLDWVNHNYSSVFLYNKSINIQQLKKFSV